MKKYSFAWIETQQVSYSVVIDAENKEKALEIFNDCSYEASDMITWYTELVDEEIIDIREVVNE